MGENDTGIGRQPLSLPSIIKLKEHDQFDESFIEDIKNLNIPFCRTDYESAPKYLGIDPETLSASYYIGADWLTDENAVVVTPKMENIDFIEMFVCALNLEPAAKYFSKFYSVDFDKKPVETDAFNDQITPLLVIHYIALLKNLIKKGLKRNYVIREENLNSKIKGKIKTSRHLRSNIFYKRDDRVFCKYQEYTVDNLENRVLKKALLLAKSYIKMLSAHSAHSDISRSVNSINAAFNDVSDDVQLYELKKITHNKLYKEYSEALRVAKMILRRFDYSILETTAENASTPVFWIDMSRLYEVYVYSKLYQNDSTILFQVPGHDKTAVDFIKINENLIIDTKYKPQYSYIDIIIDDIRQLSAYARDEKILKILENKENEIPNCLIIYPKKMAAEDEKDYDANEYTGINPFYPDKPLLSQSFPIEDFHRFSKMSIPLPIIKPNDKM